MPAALGFPGTRNDVADGKDGYGQAVKQWDVCLSLTIPQTSESPLKAPHTPPSSSLQAAADQPVVRHGADGSCGVRRASSPLGEAGIKACRQSANQAFSELEEQPRH